MAGEPIHLAILPKLCAYLTLPLSQSPSTRKKSHVSKRKQSHDHWCCKAEERRGERSRQDKLLATSDSDDDLEHEDYDREDNIDPTITDVVQAADTLNEEEFVWARRKAAATIEVHCHKFMQRPEQRLPDMMSQPAAAATIMMYWPLKDGRMPIKSWTFRERFQFDLIDFLYDPFGVLMCWILVLKDHETGYNYICTLSRKRAKNLIAY